MKMKNDTQVFSYNGVKLTDKVINMMYEFEGRTGQKPKAIYVGYKTRIDLLDEAGSALLFRLPTIEIPHSEFYGVPIFIVDEEEHLNVG